MWMALIILSINIVYISLLTIRLIFVVKGRKVLASMICFVEAFIFVLGISLVIDNLDNILNLFAYAAGFALGILTGSKIEERLALGYVLVKVISKNDVDPFAETIRKKGFGVTSWLGEGKTGKRLVMEILTSRKDQRDLYNYILAYDPEAFIVSHEPQHFRGGFWVDNLRKYCKKHGRTLEHPFEDNLPGIDMEIIEEMKSDLLEDEPCKDDKVNTGN